MGNTKSQCFESETEDVWWKPEKPTINKENYSQAATPEKREARSNEDKLDEFRQELARKHEKRRQIIAEKRKEMQDMRDELLKQRKENEELKKTLRRRSNDEENESEIVKENDCLKMEVEELRSQLTKSYDLAQKNNELRTSIAELQKELQLVNSEVVNFEKERSDYKLHVTALKDVVRVSKEMLQIRENQIKELRDKVSEIEASLAGRELHVLSEDLKQEYERQLRNIRNLRTLYEERQRADKREKEELASQLEDAKKDLEAEQSKISELENRISELETDNSQKCDTIRNLESNLGLSKAEYRDLQSEMAAINQLFSHILLDFKNCQDLDLDKLIKLLEENHDLLQNIAVNEDSIASSALPKVLLDLVAQMKNKEGSEDNSEDQDIQEQGKEKLETIEEESESQTSSHRFNSAEEIVENLPKVWKVLIELLSHQSAPVNVLTEEEAQDSENPCYKLVQSPKGPRLVLSVSQTFIRLKNLILEKKSLEKETGHLKQLNTHLEVRLQDQEKRLELVSNELSKTWHVVGKMQKQHQQLHTQEKILRYELAQKRKLLTELKEELEYCREKWLQAREKNSSTQAQWNQLRNEFASRKSAVHDDLNNSVESGYSDERGSSTDEEEPGYETDISESHKISSPETVSEQIDVNVTSEGTNDEENILHVIRDQIEEIEGGSTATPGESSSLPGETSVSVSKNASSWNSAEVAALGSDETFKRLDQIEEDGSVTTSSQATEIPEEPSTSTSENACLAPQEDIALQKDERLKNLNDVQTIVTSSSTNLSERSPASEELKDSPKPSLELGTCNDTSSKDENLKRRGEIEATDTNLMPPPEEPLFPHASSASTSQNSSSRAYTEDVILPKDESLNRLGQIQETEASSTLPGAPLGASITEEIHLEDTASTNNESLKRLELEASSTSTPPKPPPLPAAPDVFRFPKPFSKTKDVALTREERLTRLEEQTKQLMSRVSETASKRVSINAKLDNLHEIYGESSGAGNSNSANDCGSDSVVTKTKIEEDGNDA